MQLSSSVVPMQQHVGIVWQQAAPCLDGLVQQGAGKGKATRTCTATTQPPQSTTGVMRPAGQQVLVGHRIAATYGRAAGRTLGRHMTALDSSSSHDARTTASARDTLPTLQVAKPFPLETQLEAQNPLREL